MFPEYIAVALLLANSAQSQSIPPELFSPLIAQKLAKTAGTQTVGSSFPQYTYPNGTWQYFPADTWTSAFLSGSFYLLQQRFTTLCPGSSAAATDEDAANWTSEGRDWSEDLTQLEAQNTLGHDVGFISQPFRDDVTLNAQNSTALSIVEAFNADLAARYSSIVGCTKSWDGPTDNDFEVIMDNMQNLVLFLFTETMTGNETLTDMAMSHANKTIENHVRDDGSSFHVVDYDPTTGDVQWKGTAQGYSNTSTWSRGQAWGIYGFATMFNYTRAPVYLDTSRQMAQYFLTHLPSAGVPYWDFDVPTSPPPTYDTSAATIASSGLLFLSSLEASLSPPNTTGANYYAQAAIQLLTNTISMGWRTEDAWDSLLSNGTVNNRASPPINNTGIVYGDYYFIEAGNRLLSMGLANCSALSSNSSSPSSTASASASASASSTSKPSSALQSCIPDTIYLCIALALFSCIFI